MLQRARASGIALEPTDGGVLIRDPFANCVLLRTRFATQPGVAALPLAVAATWRSGYAAACKAVYTGSIPVVASSLRARAGGP